VVGLPLHKNSWLLATLRPVQVFLAVSNAKATQCTNFFDTTLKLTEGKSAAGPAASKAAAKIGLILVPEELIDGFARAVAVVQSTVGDLPDGVSLARVSDDRANLYLVNGHRQPVAQQVDTLARSTAAAAATAATRRSVTAPGQLARQQLGTSPNTVTTFKAKFHYASWFGASSELASVTKFGFYCARHRSLADVTVFTLVCYRTQ